MRIQMCYGHTVSFLFQIELFTIKFIKMETKYSRKPFDGFTHRFTVQFITNLEYPSNIDIYSNSDSYQKLDDFVNEKKSKNVKSFSIVNRSTKEYDEACSKLIDETFKDW